jgi:hypothetical protein
MEIESQASPDDGVEGGTLPLKRRRIAVIAIHGVADQKLGDTCQTLAELLVARAPNGFAYEASARRDEILQAKILEPIQRVPQADKLSTKFSQSIGSDFLRQGNLAKGRRRSLAAPRAPLTTGADFSDYTLAQAKEHGTPTDTYAAPQISLTRRKGAHLDDVDIHEMYWADLSRLSGSVPRILTELFTLLFRLSTLGRDTVATQAAAAAFHDDPFWRVVSYLQSRLDFAYSRVLALLFLQLVMVALILVPFGLLASDVVPLHHAASLIAGSAAGLGCFYWYRQLLLALVIAAAVGAALWLAPGVWVVGGVWVVLLSVLYDWWMRVCDERFPAVRAVGWVLWPIAVVAVIVCALRGTSNDLAMWVWGALGALEVMLGLIFVWWIVAAPFMLAWLCVSAVASHRRGAGNEAATGIRAKSSVATGRVGFFVSLGFFIMITMTAWALVTTGVERAVEHVPYVPILFVPAPSLIPGDAVAPGLATADRFLDERFISSTSGFSVISVLLFPLVLYLVLMLLPSVLAEVEVLLQQADRLGRWLTGGYRRLDLVVVGFVTAGVGAAVAAAVVLSTLVTGIDLVPSWAAPYLKMFSELSKDWLKYFVISAGTATVALTAAGGVLSRYAPWLRAPLDAALDVDNHFREFPRKAIPRARIFSRYFALLQHVAAQNYDRVVIVSHSQGTVISTDLLRYLKERAAIAGKTRDEEVKKLWDLIGSKIMLVTAGCPLRQLYAARFPEMYDWVLCDHGNVLGPVAADVGVALWVNVYATGDYVGRWLWTRETREREYPVSQIDETRAGETYTPTAIDASSRRALMKGATEKDVSVGAGAHTHYFASEEAVMASIVDALIGE